MLNATKACELYRWKDSTGLATLAAAYAESGDFKQAVEQQKKAIELASEENRAAYLSRLKLYKQGKPYRDEKK